jgi:hypothetical protein
MVGLEDVCGGSGARSSAQQPVEHRADPIERLLDGGPLGRGDVPLGDGDPQRDGDLAGAARGDLAVPPAVAVAAESALAEVERDARSP